MKRTKKEIEFSILGELAKDDLSWTELMKRTNTAPPVLSSHLKRLEAEKRIVYAVDPENRRKGKYRLVDLTFYKAVVLAEWFDDYSKEIVKKAYQADSLEDLKDLEKEDVRILYHAIAGAYSEYLFFLLNNKEKIEGEFQFIINGLFESAERFIDKFIGVFGELPSIPINGEVAEKIFHYDTMDDIKKLKETLNQ